MEIKELAKILMNCIVNSEQKANRHKGSVLFDAIRIKYEKSMWNSSILVSLWWRCMLMKKMH